MPNYRLWATGFDSRRRSSCLTEPADIDHLNAFQSTIATIKRGEDGPSRRLDGLVAWCPDHEAMNCRISQSSQSRKSSAESTRLPVLKSRKGMHEMSRSSQPPWSRPLTKAVPLSVASDPDRPHNVLTSHEWRKRIVRHSLVHIRSMAR
jgi:hypothetical protein